MAFLESLLSWNHPLQQQVPVAWSTVAGCGLAAAQHLPILQTQSSPAPPPRTCGDLQTR